MDLQSLSLHPRYSLVKELGRGGSGRVYLALDRLSHDAKVALKVCNQQVPPERVLREFRALRELRHPALARAFDYGRSPNTGQSFFTMDYVPGPDLATRGDELRQRGSYDELFDIALDLCGVLAYLHERGLVHRDVKLQNIVFQDDSLRLIDFGLFQNLYVPPGPTSAGTARYAAPEVFSGGPIDQRADLYSLGVTLGRVFTGRFPIDGSCAPDTAEPHRRGQPTLSEFPVHGVVPVVEKLLAKDPARRFQSARDVFAALQNLRGGPPPPLGIAHVAIDRTHTTAEDVASYFPLAAYQRAVARGALGAVADRFYGLPTDRSVRATTRTHAPKLVELCQADRVDAAVLVPNCPVCHQSVALAANALEAAGIATVVLGCALDIVEHVGVPRLLFSDLPLGNAGGPPHDTPSQDSIAMRSLELLAAATAPRTTWRTAVRWPGRADWRLDYANPDRLSDAERAEKRAEFERVKTERDSQPRPRAD
ncbi:MAG: serine/threonine-protein kinase [Pseudomonadota bacterium]